MAIVEAPCGSWSDAAPLTHARYGATALRLGDGRVLVRGGKWIDVERARKVGGAEWVGHDVEADELWTPDDLAWRDIPKPMANELAKGAIAPRKGKPAPRWAKHTVKIRGLDLLTVERAQDSLAAVGKNSVLVAGGYLTWSAFHGEESYDLIAGTAVFRGKDGAWIFAGDLSCRRSTATAVALADGRVMLIGGKDVNSSATFSNVEIWQANASAKL